MAADLKKIEKWAKTWKVTFNASKSKEIIFSKKEPQDYPAIMFNGEIIENVTTLKHLGLMLSSTLDWTAQINYVALKANRKLSVLRI